MSKLGYYEVIDKRTMETNRGDEMRLKGINYVCRDCGIKYCPPPKDNSMGGGTTFHQGKCDLCKKEKSYITAIRNYRYLPLLKDKKWEYKKATKFIS